MTQHFPYERGATFSLEHRPPLVNMQHEGISPKWFPTWLSLQIYPTYVQLFDMQDGHVLGDYFITGQAIYAGPVSPDEEWYTVHRKSPQPNDLQRQNLERWLQSQVRRLRALPAKDQFFTLYFRGISSDEMPWPFDELKHSPHVGVLLREDHISPFVLQSPWWISIPPALHTVVSLTPEAEREVTKMGNLLWKRAELVVTDKELPLDPLLAVDISSASVGPGTSMAAGTLGVLLVGPPHPRPSWWTQHEDDKLDVLFLELEDAVRTQCAVGRGKQEVDWQAQFKCAHQLVRAFLFARGDASWSSLFWAILVLASLILAYKAYSGYEDCERKLSVWKLTKPLQQLGFISEKQRSEMKREILEAEAALFEFAQFQPCRPIFPL